MPGLSVTRQLGDDRRQQPAMTAQPLAVSRLARQIREQARQVRAGIPDPAPLAGDTQQLLRHGQADQLRMGRLRLAARQIVTRPSPAPARRGRRDQRRVPSGGCPGCSLRTIFDALRLVFRSPAGSAAVRSCGRSAESSGISTGVNDFVYSSIPGEIFSAYFGNNAYALYNSVANL